MHRRSLFKRWLSYLTELHVESAPSELNPHLYVSLRNGRYQLCTANAIYSYGDLYNNFTRIFDQLNWDLLDMEEVLVLGFGLGSVPIILEKMQPRKYHFTGIEVDEVVAYLGHIYGLPDIQSPTEIIIADAYHYAVQCQYKYDFIAMDVFQDDVVPPEFEEIDFLENLKSILRADGILIYNRLANTKEDIEKTRNFFENTFRSVFPFSTYRDVGGNWMLVNDRNFLK